MEALVFGHAGTPVIVFPTSMGKFFEYEDRGMIGVLAPKIERGELQLFCPDGVDTESWYNKSVHPRVRVLRHLQYERYIAARVPAFRTLEESGLAARRYWMQLRRLPLREFRHEASGCGHALREHERGV